MKEIRVLTYELFECSEVEINDYFRNGWELVNSGFTNIDTNRPVWWFILTCEKKEEAQ